MNVGEQLMSLSAASTAFAVYKSENKSYSRNFIIKEVQVPFLKASSFIQQSLKIM